MTSVVQELSLELNAAMAAPLLLEPGLYRNVSEEDYHGRLRYVSHSGLRDMEVSPAHLLYNREHPRPETEAQTNGRFLHISLLEPHCMKDTFVRGPAGNWNLKANRTVVEGLRAEDPRRTVLHEDDYDNIIAARDAVLAHPTAGQLVRDAWGYEVSAVWDHREVANIRCKARADILRPDLSCIVDLKKTVRATDRAFARSVSEYDYTMQAALYIDGFNEVFDPKDRKAFDTFVFIAIENEPPYGVSVFEIRPEDIEAGRRRYMRLLRRYAECVRTNEWPSYPSEIRYLDLPDWTRTREE